MKRLGFLLPLALLMALSLGAPGCSSSSETTTTETTVTNPDVPPPETTTTTTTTKSDEPDSVLGATFHAIGTIILFPFRLIGDTLGLIF